MKRLGLMTAVSIGIAAAVFAQAGQRTALNLQGIEVADIQRGMVLTIPNIFTPTPMFVLAMNVGTA